MQGRVEKESPPLKGIFFAFLKIGSLAFGGVYAMLALVERELVERRKWISHQEFSEGVAVGQLTPGAPIVNTGIFIGYTLKKVKGVIAATLGQVLPSFLVILCVSWLYVKYQDMEVLRASLKGISGAVVGMVASVVLGMGRKSLRELGGISFASAAFIALSVLKINPIVVIILSGLAGLVLYRKESGGLS